MRNTIIKFETFKHRTKSNKLYLKNGTEILVPNAKTITEALHHKNVVGLI